MKPVSMPKQRSQKSVYLHKVFGFAEPVPGFEETIMIDADPSPLVPKIDPDYVFQPDMVARVLLSYGARENMMFNGEKGTGKSSFVTQFCARLNIPLMSITGGPGVDETYLMGSKTITDGSVKSVDGIVSYCLRHGIALLIDEAAAIKPAVQVAINDVVNGDEVITLKHHGLDPEIEPDALVAEEGSLSIKRHKRFRLFATDNTGGKMTRDPRFIGVNTQNSATRSRWTCFKMSFMKPALELKALIGATGGALPVEVGKFMVEMAIRVRASFEQGDMSDTMSFRELKRWARKSLMYGTQKENVNDKNKPLMLPDCAKAFVDAVYTGMEETDQDVVREFYELVFGTELELPIEYTETARSFLDALESNTLDWGVEETAEAEAA
ncbi:AAA family ATPase [Pseudomonas putida]|uniref:AAA family ATPase n=1 Tax=Pseudomonas putida TaxID=303 RepID=UPI002363EED0|nr:AAA family ATPase [Pseudomonas putida]MDD2139618.1 AAA family ATPase [Pseudomonas putida]HDS1721541.1 AAA family ATPase [Pseudomonas putida]